MKYIMLFEEYDKTKFAKVIKVADSDKRKGYEYVRTVGSDKKYTEANFKHLELVFGDKLSEYQDWLCGLYPCTGAGYRNPNYYFDENLQSYLLYNLDLAYREKLLKQRYKGVDKENRHKKYLELKKDYVIGGWERVPEREGPTPKHHGSIKNPGASTGPKNLKEHPFKSLILDAIFVPKNADKAHVIAGTEKGKEIIANKNKQEKASTYFQRIQFNQIKNSINEQLSEINYSETRFFDLYSKLQTLSFKSLVNADNKIGVRVLDKDTILTIETNKNNIYTRRFEDLMNYLNKHKDSLSERLNVKKISIDPENPYKL